MYTPGLQYLAQPHPPTMVQPATLFAVPPAQGSSQMAQWEPQPMNNRMDLDVSNALLQGVANRNAMGRKAVYDQLTPGLPALFGRHAPASQRLIWCDTSSNDDATKLARKNFSTLKDEAPEMMKYAVMFSSSA
ncbi:hypothetical protein FRC07_001485 [Ceratobasidium sp. 392]|nr:hypothetical protein FRC07_001485 [Ceratobasidium sp. 392]